MTLQEQIEYDKMKDEKRKQASRKFVMNFFIGIIIFIGIGFVLQEIGSYSINQKRTLNQKSEQIIKLLNTLNHDDPRIPINYGKYGYYHPDLTVNCLDYSFAFAILFGEDAWVSSNNDHAFVTVNGVKIEPQQKWRLANDVQTYRISGTNYNITKSVAHFDETDIQAVYKYFGLED